MGRVVRGLPLAEFAGDDERLTIAYLTEQERMRCIRPEWRFSSVDDHGHVGSRVVYWGLPDEDRPMLIDLVFSEGGDAVGEVLATSLRELAIDEIDYVPDRPAGGGRSSRREPAELEAVGFALVATQVRLAYAGDGLEPPPPAGIEVRPATDDALRALIAAVAEASDDRGSRDRDPATELSTLRRMDHDPGSWELAVDRASGQPLGFVLPARTGEGAPVIAFIGVIPEARGRGLGRYLLARGTTSLRREAPAPVRIIADVDETNVAMLRVAAAVGFSPCAGRAHYRRHGRSG